jgi:putative acetyltransferase
MKPRPSELTIRLAGEQDTNALKGWLLDPAVLRWFPMQNEREVDDAVRIWMGYTKIGAGLTAEWNGVCCGMFNLYIQPFKKLAHTCLFSIIVDEGLRGKGIGQALIEEGEKLAKEKFGIEVLHLEVYKGNPAQRLYEKMGFVSFGEQKHFIKDNGEYIAKVFMQKSL